MPGCWKIRLAHSSQSTGKPILNRSNLILDGGFCDEFCDGSGSAAFAMSLRFPVYLSSNNEPCAEFWERRVCDEFAMSLGARSFGPGNTRPKTFFLFV